MSSKPATATAKKQLPLSKRITANWQLYLLLLIPVIITVIYKYIPMYGIQIAFRDYKASRGYLGSEWVVTIHGVGMISKVFGSSSL